MKALENDYFKERNLYPNVDFYTGIMLRALGLPTEDAALLALRTHWVRSRRLRMHTFNRRLMEIAAGARRETELSQLLQRKQQLVDVLQEVVHDLEGEKVSQEEFEHFSFTWQAVDALVRDRLLMTDSLPAGRVESAA